MVRVNPEWFNEIQLKIESRQIIDQIISFNPGAQAVIACLTRANRAFKVYNLGAGVRRITTNTEICPCCKRKL